MKTEKLYDIDSHLCEFDAAVLSCEASKGGYKIMLDKTAFFPEGGGQASDRGTLDTAEVVDVQIENGEIYHYCDKALAVGGVVRGKLDFARRHTFMQNHTGEHIVSGILHKLYGFSNVGFHLGEEFATLDFNGELTREQLDEVEYLANLKVWQNLPVKTYYPDKEQLGNLDYRSKGELEGDIRIVEITDTDMCACCAPHVKNTGEIGVIKLLDTLRMRGGTRVIFKCGSFALLDYRKKYKNAVRISNLLSAKQADVADAVDMLASKLDAEKQAHQETAYRMINQIIDAANTRVVFVENLQTKELQALADGLHKAKGGLCGAFSKREEGYAFAICDEEEPLQKFFSEFKEKFTVRGGGRGTMVQGTVYTNEEEIKLFF